MKQIPFSRDDPGNQFCFRYASSLHVSKLPSLEGRLSSLALRTFPTGLRRRSREIFRSKSPPLDTPASPPSAASRNSDRLGFLSGSPAPGPPSCLSQSPVP